MVTQVTRRTRGACPSTRSARPWSARYQRAVPWAAVRRLQDRSAPDLRSHLAMGESSHPAGPSLLESLHGNPTLAHHDPSARTATCPHCRQVRNRLSVYPNFEGKACYSCLMSSSAAHHALVMVAAPAIAEPVAVSVTPCARPSTCPEAG